MTMMRWDPYREMTSLRQAMDRLFEDTFMWPARSQYEMAGGNLPLDIYQTKDDVVVKAALPGMKPEEVDISIIGDIAMECSAARRRCRLPFRARKPRPPSKNGMLTLTLPKAEAVKPKQIKVKAKSALEIAKK